MQLNPDTIGAQLRAHRKAAGLSLERLSRQAGVGKRFLSELERGKSTAELGKTLDALHALGLELTLTSRQPTVRFADTQSTEPLSAQLGLEGVYDWSNPRISPELLIRKVLQSGRFNDLVRVVKHFGMDAISEAVNAIDGGVDQDYLHGQLDRIRLAADRAGVAV